MHPVNTPCQSERLSGGAGNSSIPCWAPSAWRPTAAVTLLPPSFPDVSAAAHTHYRPESARCRDLTNATHFAEHQTARIYIIAAQAGRLTVRVVDIVVSGGRVTDCHCRRRLVTGRSRSRRSLGTRPRNQEARHESSKLKGPNSAQAGRSAGPGRTVLAWGKRSTCAVPGSSHASPCPAPSLVTVWSRRASARGQAFRAEMWLA